MVKHFDIIMIYYIKKHLISDSFVISKHIFFSLSYLFFENRTSFDI